MSCLNGKVSIATIFEMASRKSNQLSMHNRIRFIRKGGRLLDGEQVGGTTPWTATLAWLRGLACLFDPKGSTDDGLYDQKGQTNGSPLRTKSPVSLDRRLWSE